VQFVATPERELEIVAEPVEIVETGRTYAPGRAPKRIDHGGTDRTERRGQERRPFAHGDLVPANL
jgi:hypothetical protein